MAIYLKQFETEAAYEAAQGSLILPNVSFVTERGAVHYTTGSTPPPTPTHDYVEIDGIKWATMNVGANSVTDPGLYFQWGDTQGYTAEQVGSGEGKKNFGWGDYKYADDAGMTKYNSSDGKTVLDLSDDAARANWGDSWRMPTISEYIRLREAVTTAWTESYQGSGVVGLVCVDKTDSSKELFFPGVSCCADGYIWDDNICYYWSSTLFTGSTDDNGCQMSTQYGQMGIESPGNRPNGLSVRGILDE